MEDIRLDNQNYIKEGTPMSSIISPTQSPDRKNEESDKVRKLKSQLSAVLKGKVEKKKDELDF